VNGEARAYPKRILAWHELARDRVGGVELAIVYCTLCGTVIPYEAMAGGKLRVLGTSGFLYRSNKLMFDEETKSLWSTLEGRPVIGPLAGSGVELRYRPVVTTTWGEWRAAHPGTTVLSLDTGHQRDYSEGAAYREYFGTDELMFQVPEDGFYLTLGFCIDFKIRLGPRRAILTLQILPHQKKRHEKYLHHIGDKKPQRKRGVGIKTPCGGCCDIPPEPQGGPGKHHQEKSHGADMIGDPERRALQPRQPLFLRNVHIAQRRSQLLQFLQ